MEEKKKSLASRIPAKVWLLISFLVAMLAWGMLIRTGSEPPTSREPSPAEVVK